MSEDRPLAGAAGEIRVLHVDDEPEFADLTTEYLQREDDRLRIETATSAEEGMDLLAEYRADCVVSDYDMPGTSGIEFLESVRAEYPDLPFILFTGKGSEEIASDAISAGVTDYLQKGGAEQYELLATRIENAVDRHRAEREAERTRTRLAAITENSTEAILTVDEGGTVRFANPAVADIFGYAPGDVVGRPLTTLVPERLREDYRASFRRYLETGERTHEWSSTEFTGRHADGHEIPLSVSLRQFEIEGERRLASVLRDMTDIEESRRRLQTLISNLPGIVYRCRNETGWPMEQVEGECESLTGYTARAIESGDVVWGEEIIHPADRDHTWDAVQEAIATGEAFEVTYRIETADGATRWMWERGRAVETDGEGPTTLEGFMTDITEREQRKRVLEHERDRLAAVFDAVPHPITEVEFRDDEPIVKHVNEAFEEVFGYPEQHVVGESLDEFVVPEEHSEEATNLNRSARNSRTAQQEVERVTADGEHRMFLLRSARVSEEGETYLGAYIDITERTERERQLRRQNERLDQFASVVSHDLRNPLNVASARLELASDECDSPHLADVADAHERMEHLIGDLLTFARAGSEAVEPRAIELRGLTEECWKTLQAGAATLVVETEETIRADRDRLQQLLENLLANAVEHGSTGPRSEFPDDAGERGGTDVTVRVGDLPGGFYVADDGPGIPAEQREQVFEPGYSTSRQGTGFGLSIVRELADLQGWTVRVTEGETGGARFEITGVDTV